MLTPAMASLFSCVSHSSPPKPDLRGESNNIQDVELEGRGKDAMDEMTTLLKELVVLMRDINQRQTLLGM
jgi:hypothetical protein